jgi:hypothetical protein
MTINGNVSIATYFILNKKDRTGKSFPRPFQIVLDEMKRQETEDAKKKQSNSLKGGNELSPPSPAPKENGLVEARPSSPAPSTENPTPARPIEVPVPVKIIPKEEVTAHTQTSITKTTIIDDQPMKSSGVISEPRDSTKSFNRQSQSRACELL